MTVREASHSDIPNALRMGRKFHAQSGQEGRFDDESFAETAKSLIDQDNAILLISDNSMLGGVLFPSFCDREWLMGVELFWWSENGSGIELAKRFEAWALAKGAKEVRMTTQEANKRPNKLLERKGYRPMETSFKRVVSCH